MSKKLKTRAQAPKQRNFVKKNMDRFQRPETHQDQTKYVRSRNVDDDLLDYYEWLDDDEV